jgi:hypothetical protein
MAWNSPSLSSSTSKDSTHIWVTSATAHLGKAMKSGGIVTVKAFAGITRPASAIDRTTKNDEIATFRIVPPRE